MDNEEIIKEEKQTGKWPEGQGFEEVVFDKDVREEVTQPDKYPYCSIGIIDMNFGNKRGQGTGCLIGKDIVLTCGHVCYARTSKVK